VLNRKFIANLHATSHIQTRSMQACALNGNRYIASSTNIGNQCCN